MAHSTSKHRQLKVRTWFYRLIKNNEIQTYIFVHFIRTVQYHILAINVSTSSPFLLLPPCCAKFHKTIFYYNQSKKFFLFLQNCSRTPLKPALTLTAGQRISGPSLCAINSSSIFPSLSIQPVHQPVSQCFRAVGSLAACLPLHHWPSSFTSSSSSYSHIVLFLPFLSLIFFTCSSACCLLLTSSVSSPFHPNSPTQSPRPFLASPLFYFFITDLSLCLLGSLSLSISKPFFLSLPHSHMHAITASFSY